MQQRRSIGITLLTLCMLAACGESPSLTLSESSKTVNAGGGPTTFTATLTGTEGTVTWALTGPGSVSTTTGTSTDYTPPATVASPTNATLTATSGTLSASVAITIHPPPTITVGGKVVNVELQPMSSLVVRIVGHADATSGTDGAFNIMGVTTPYDVAVMDTTNKIVMLFKGLTRPDPTLMFLSSGGAAPRTANLSGTVSGGTNYPESANHKSMIAFGAAGLLSTGSDSIDPTTGAFDLFAAWSGSSTIVGTLYALQWQTDVSNLPVAYKGYGTKANVTLADSGTFTNQNVTMAPVNATTMTGSVSVPAGYTLSSKQLYFHPHPTAFMQLAYQPGATPGFTYTTPNISGTNVMLTASAHKASTAGVDAWKSTLAPHATDVSLIVPAAPEHIVPEQNATGVTYTTPFSWHPFMGVCTWSPSTAAQANLTSSS